jgi:acetyltransferase-like isoleucine patch superfamily enzyme
MVSPSLLQKALANPTSAVGVVIALIRGWMVRVSCRVRGVRFSAGRNLRVFGRLRVRGPGQVILGDNVVVDMEVTPFTYATDAVIRVGNRCFLNGTRFGCARAITIGDDCILADARIMDTDFHSTAVNRHHRDAPVRVLPIVIEDNVWVAAASGILPGTHIGRDSVVGFGSVCSGRLESGFIFAGNPARPIRPLADRTDSHPEGRP